MFGGIGFTELLIIAAVALVVLGPERFPEYAKIAARFVKDVRGYMTEIQREVGKEMKPVQQELAKLSKIDPEKYLDALTKEDKPRKNGEEDAPNPEPEYTVDGTFSYDSFGSQPAQATATSEAGAGEDTESRPVEGAGVSEPVKSDPSD